MFTVPKPFIHVRKSEVSHIESIRFQYEYSGVNLTTNPNIIDLSRLIKLGNSNILKFKLLLLIVFHI